ncbi:MAG: tetratricopeptide repeat protein [Rhodoferax sp.]|uniref:nuclear transport factor 2 family protein n=1 Tax=Rhodoferax sp. TaxID=50421 RepID=UPI0013FF3476|nr:tetratricopeptide repeat protein [Rhodoferax sp.]NDP37502.1 tetratricopeptide repeat protein [Rhodoferax sp.]
MKLARTPFFTTLRLLALALACTTSIAYADDYGDVGQLLHAGKLSEAMVKADGYLAAKPADPQMRFLKGVIQRNQGKQAEAIATFTKLTEDYPELPEPYNNLAVLYAGQNQFDKARAALEMAIRTNPSYATAHENLGDIYARLASQAYNKALQLDGANPAVPPKLALIRELFGPNNKGQRPATAALAAAPAAVAKPSTPAPTAPPAVAPAPPSATSAPVAAAKPAASDSATKDAKDVQEAVQAWARAWAAKDMTAYLGAYGKEFDPAGKQSRNAWEADRRSRIVGKNTISVKLDHVNVTVNGAQAVAKFRQDYRSGTLAVSSRKTLELVKTGNRWLIVKESTGN